MTPGSTAAHRAAADWASRVAEQLPAADITRLADAAAQGEDSVRALRGRAPAAVLRVACDQLVTHLSATDPAYLAGLLAGACHALQRARQQQSVDVVWTGPDPGTGSGRLTAATVIDLISQARREILLVSYATHTEPGIDAALAAAASHGVEITLLAERHDDNPGYTAVGIPFPGLDAIRLRWPASQRSPGAALHAKIIVVDNRIALVGSANLTSRAMEANLECGVLISGGPIPQAISTHVADLRASGCLQIEVTV